MSRVTPETLTVHVPFTLRLRGGRKVMVMPAGAPDPRPQVDNTMVKALARAFRWKRMLDSGEFTTIAELAGKEKLAVSYLARVLRLAQLAPDIVEAIVAGTHLSEMTLAQLLKPFPSVWQGQLGRLELIAPPAFSRRRKAIITRCQLDLPKATEIAPRQCHQRGTPPLSFFPLEKS